MSIPKYLQIKRHLQSRIESGDCRSNERIPSEQELAGQFGVSRQTVRQALGELEHEGWLYRVQGKGTFVRPGSGSGAAAGPASGNGFGIGGTAGRTIGIVTTYISDYIFPAIIRGAESVLRERGYGMMLASTDNDRDKERDCLNRLTGYPLRGMIVEPTRSADGRREIGPYLALERMGVPYVMIHESYPELGCPVVKVDDEHGGFAAAEHLIGLGHRRIAGVFKSDDLQGVYRVKGYLRAMRKHGLVPDPSWLVRYDSDNRLEAPARGMADLLALPAGQRPTAAVCYNDEIALQVIEAARSRGLRVPEDLSVVGFDDSALAVASDVKLTTIARPKEELGRQAAELLLRLMEGTAAGADADALSVTFRPELVIRASTAAPAPDGEPATG